VGVFQADGKLQKVLPLVIYGIVTIIAALLSISLPETRKRKLLEQVEDAEHENEMMTERLVSVLREHKHNHCF
jgi:flagellar biosynthesis/type III secretory pathway M-ring protein FliF/YscJ